jgi:hypothetical protein
MVYDLANIVDLIAVDLISTDIIESAPTGICVLGILEERHWRRMYMGGCT